MEMSKQKKVMKYLIHLHMQQDPCLVLFLKNKHKSSQVSKDNKIYDYMSRTIHWYNRIWFCSNKLVQSAQ